MWTNMGQAGIIPGPAYGKVYYGYSILIDLTVTGTYQVIPAMPFRLRPPSVGQFEIKSVTSCSVSPTFSVGTNSASFNNLSASQTVAGFTAQAAETFISPTTVSPASALDLTASGLLVNVTGGATATALTAIYYVTVVLLPV